MKEVPVPQSVLPPPRSLPAPYVLCTVLALVLCAASCGKKGPPLPPLVRLPVAPSELTAARRADMVDLQFTVPNANTDNTRPANVTRVDVYAFTGPATVSDAEILSGGTRVASVPVKAPRDPDATFDPDDPTQSEADVDPPEGDGLDQGAVAHVQEKLPQSEPADEVAAQSASVRTYVGVGITTGGRRGPSSQRAAVPLTPPPPPPGKPDVRYGESSVTVTWSPPATEAASPFAYNVYEIELSGETRLTQAVLVDAHYADTRMTWGATRCYGVRTVESADGLVVESERSEPGCVTLTDTFPPGPPTGLRAVASAGAINLIWDANAEADLDGYFLLRGPAPGDELIPISTTAMRETAFEDRVPPGMRFVYAVQAVDRSGNLSPVSGRIEETAR
jgi:hypothetical protein